MSTCLLGWFCLFVWTSFNIEGSTAQYPLFITFSADGDSDWKAKAQEKSVKISCAWHLGDSRHPPTGHLYQYSNKRRVELKSNTVTTTSLTHVYPTVQCSDAGIYSCEVGDVGVNKTLLVKCPPDVTPVEDKILVHVGDTARLQFYVRAYTGTFTSCTLFQTASDDAVILQQKCLSSLTLTGFLPDMTASVLLINVTKENSGTWHLELANEVGPGEKSPNFIIQVTEPKAAADEAPGTTAVIVVVAVSVVVVMTVVCVMKGSCRQRCQQKLFAERLDDVIRRIVHRNPDVRAAHAHSSQSESTSHYQEIPEDQLPNNANVYANIDVPRNLVTEPGGYLRPTINQRLRAACIRQTISPAKRNPRDHNQPDARSADINPHDQSQSIATPEYVNLGDYISLIGASPNVSRSKDVQVNRQCSNSAACKLLSAHSKPAMLCVCTALKTEHNPARDLSEETTPMTGSPANGLDEETTLKRVAGRPAGGLNEETTPKCITGSNEQIVEAPRYAVLPSSNRVNPSKYQYA